MHECIKAAARAIENADALLIMAGAGMGVDSGLPDYRGNEGLWRAYPRLGDLGLSFEAIASPSWFDKNPRMAWAFYGHRQKLYRDTVPHPGYALLQGWAENMPAGLFVYTSNVDGHFQDAGYPADRIVECHGNLHRYQCCEPCHNHIWRDDPRDFRIDLSKLKFLDPLPRCPKCGELARPNVMMFFDWDYIRDLTIAQMDRYNAWLSALEPLEARIVVLEIGAGASLPAVRRESERLLTRPNTLLIRINPREADGPNGVISIPLGALDALERIDGKIPKGFKRRCEETQAHTEDAASQETIRERIAAFFKGNSGGVVSTLTGTHLSVLKHQKVYAKPCRITLTNGWGVSVERLEMDRTYSGMIEGVPDKGHIQQFIREAEEHASKRFGGPKIKVIKPQIYDAESDQPLLPPLRFIARVECHKARDQDEDGTWLTLVWFAEIDDDQSIADRVRMALGHVDWEREADGYRI